jgi:hypothetical protein
VVGGVVPSSYWRVEKVSDGKVGPLRCKRLQLCLGCLAVVGEEVILVPLSNLRRLYWNNSLEESCLWACAN